MSQQIDFSKCRQKITSTQKVVKVNDTYQVLKKIKHWALDPDLKSWTHWKTTEEYESVATLGLLKRIIQVIYLKKSALDQNTMQTVSKWFKLIRKISVIDPDSNIFLTEADGRVFQTDLTTTCSVEFNSLPYYLKVEDVKEYPLDETELKELNEILANDKIVVKPLMAEKLQTGEIRLIC